MATPPMTDLSAVVPVPEEVRRRAWECGWDLTAEFYERLPLGDRVMWLLAAAAGLEHLIWGYWPFVGGAFRAHRRMVGVRT